MGAPTLDELWYQLRASRTAYKDSIDEARLTVDAYHDRTYTSAEISELKAAGRPVESFNVIKLTSHALLGFFRTVANKVKIDPATFDSKLGAAVLNDTVDSELTRNKYKFMKGAMLLDMMLVGYSVNYQRVYSTDKTDSLGRIINRTKIKRIAPLEVYLDPYSKEDDYSDARYQGREFSFPKDKIIELWGEDKVKEMTPGIMSFGSNSNINTMSKASTGRTEDEEYCIVHTITIKDGEVWEQIWNRSIILEEENVTGRLLKFPYVISKTSKEDENIDFHGIFREVYESQRAINQAILKIQLLVNTEKVLIGEDAVDNISEFKALYERVNSVIPVVDIDQIMVVKNEADIQQQYTIISNNLDRIKMVLGVNDSFLGQAYASDSGRKVQLQKQQSFAQLTWFVERIEIMQVNVGESLVKLIQQFFTAYEMLKVTDPLNGIRWIEVNKPLLDKQRGLPIYIENSNQLDDEYSPIYITYVNGLDSDLAIPEVEVVVESINFDNQYERNQLLLETVMQGPIGESLKMVNPAGYFMMAALQVRESGAKDSDVMYDILVDTAMKINQGMLDPSLAMTNANMQSILGQALGGSSGNPQNPPSSQTLQVPTQFAGGS